MSYSPISSLRNPASFTSSARTSRSRACRFSYFTAAGQVGFGRFCAPHIKAQHFRLLAPTDWLPVGCENEHASSPHLNAVPRGLKKVEERCAACAVFARTPFDFATMLNQDGGGSQ